MSEIRHYRLKPRPTSDDGVIVAKYVPGQPLDGLTKIALMADDDAELAEVSLPSGTVLLVRWMNMVADRPFLDWTIVQSGDYLEFGKRSGGLCTDGDAGLLHWYEPVE